MHSMIIFFIGLNFLTSCSTPVKVAKKAVIIHKKKAVSAYSKKYIEVLTFVSKNQRKLLSEIVDGHGRTLKVYASELGIKNRQYGDFKRALAQNLTKLIQYNEADSFQTRVQKILEEKKIALTAIPPKDL